MTAPPPGPVGPPPGWPHQPNPWDGGYPPPPPAGYPGYPGYPPYPPPAFGYPAPGYSPYPGAPAWKPGVIPLRPLSLSDIFNGAVGYVRANPKPTLGLTTVIVLLTTVIGFLTGLAATGIGGNAASAAGVVTGGAALLLTTTLLSGLLTTIVARSVVGGRITAGEAWRRARGRLPALIGLTLLQVAVIALLVGVVVLIVVAAANAAGGVVAALLGVPLVLASLAGLAALYALLALAPAAVVLEHKGVIAAIRRSVALCRPRFWRVLGILLLAAVVAALVSGAVAVPFQIAGQVLTIGESAGRPTVGGTAIAGIGQAIGQIITTPFTAGVATLLYVDARIRSEAFDFALMAASPNQDDAVWLHQ